MVAYFVNVGEDLALARQILGPGPVVMGNLNGPGLIDLRPGEVHALCAQALAQRGEDRQFILATCSADIQIETPPESMIAITEAVCRAGGVQV